MSATEPARFGTVARRLPATVVLLAVLLGALIIDNEIDDPTPDPPERTADADDFPIASRPGDLSSTWYCAGGTADDIRFADHRIHVLNTNPTPVSATLTVFTGDVLPAPDDVDDPDAPPAGDSGGAAGETEDGDASSVDPTAEPVVRLLDVPAEGRVTLLMRELVTAPIASALVEAEIGGVVVEHEIRSIHGRDVKPCASGASSTWHFAFGTTTVDTRQLMVLFNPFPDDVVVDGIFATETGIREPGRWDGLVVPGRGTIGVDLGDDVTRREELAATITARSGRLIVDRVHRYRGDAGRPRGLTVQTGVARPQLDWVFPDGFVSESISERYVVYNPSDTAAEVELEIILDDPETNGVPAPFELSISPGRYEVVDIAADGRVPAGVAHAGLVRAENDVPIVAERVIFNSGNLRRGVTVTTGSPYIATDWLFADGSTAGIDEWIIIVNLDAQVLATIDVLGLVGGQRLALSGFQGFEIPPGARVALRLGTAVGRGDLPILVRSTEPIVVERGLYVDGDAPLGTSNAIGVPIEGGIGFPEDPLTVELDDVDLGDADADDIPTPPGDVDLPSDDFIDTDDLDPDAEADVPEGEEPTTSAPPEETTTTTAPQETTTTGVPATAPPTDDG